MEAIKSEGPSDPSFGSLVPAGVRNMLASRCRVCSVRGFSQFIFQRLPHGLEILNFNLEGDVVGEAVIVVVVARKLCDL